MAVQSFKEIGLNINMSKSSCINIVQGQLTGGVLAVDEVDIKIISPSETIRYLGVNFENNNIQSPRSYAQTEE